MLGTVKLLGRHVGVSRAKARRPSFGRGAHGDPNRGRSDQRAEIVHTISYGGAVVVL
jgi:hypothetical protein